jgi:hypothetical protein
MHARRSLLCYVAAVAIAVGVAAPAPATTLMRAGLETLTAANSRIVVGEVLDARSYWNAEGTLILTDVQLSVIEVLKGKGGEDPLTITLLGGEVGDLAVQIVGGPELAPGKAYLLFLNEEDLPGAPRVSTVRDLSQGVFDLVIAGDDVRAISQAHDRSLVPDAFGRTDAPGGAEGIPLESISLSIRELASRGQTLPRR